jgi:hypothetical protein
MSVITNIVHQLFSAFYFNETSVKMSNTSAVTPFPGVFTSSNTPARLPWDTYSKHFLHSTAFLPFQSLKKL